MPIEHTEREQLIKELHKFRKENALQYHNFEAIADFILRHTEELTEEVKKGMKQALINEGLRSQLSESQDLNTAQAKKIAELREENKLLRKYGGETDEQLAEQLAKNDHMSDDIRRLTSSRDKALTATALLQKENSRRRGLVDELYKILRNLKNDRTIPKFDSGDYDGYIDEALSKMAEYK